MDKKFVGLGLVAGLAGGTAAFALARWQVTPAITSAIEYEEGRSAAEAAVTGEHAHSHEVFSRALQENIGAGVATVAFGVIMGALFAVAFSLVWTYLRRRNRGVQPRAIAVGIAGAGFVSMCLLPFLAFPANPPGVGNHETLGDRTSSYLLLTVLSVVVAVVAFIAASRLTAKVSGFGAAVIGSAGYLVTMAVVIALLPSFDEAPQALADHTGALVFPGFPARVLSDFRLYSVLSQAAMWAVIGVVFAALIGRSPSHRSPVPNHVTAVTV